MECGECLRCRLERHAQHHSELVKLASIDAATRLAPVCTDPTPQHPHQLAEAIGSTDRFASFTAARTLIAAAPDPMERLAAVTDAIQPWWPAYAVANGADVVRRATRDARHSGDALAAAGVLCSAMGFLQRVEPLCGVDGRPLVLIAVLAVIAGVAKLCAEDSSAEHCATLVQLAALPLQLLGSSSTVPAVQHKSLGAVSRVVRVLLEQEQPPWDALRLVAEQMSRFAFTLKLDHTTHELATFLGQPDTSQALARAVAVIGDILVSASEEPAASDWLFDVMSNLPEGDYAGRAVALYSDDDTALVHAMRQLLLMWLWCGGKLSPPPSAHPHRVFIAFGSSIGFDHTILIEFLISQETAEFVEYLSLYLKLMQQQQSNDVADRHLEWSKCLVELEASMRKLVERDLFPYNCSPILRRLNAVIDAYPVPVVPAYTPNPH